MTAVDPREPPPRRAVRHRRRRAGAAGRNWVERADGTRETFGATFAVEMQPGDVFVIETPGGGGFGARMTSACVREVARPAACAWTRDASRSSRGCADYSAPGGPGGGGCTARRRVRQRDEFASRRARWPKRLAPPVSLGRLDALPRARHEVPPDVRARRRAARRRPASRAPALGACSATCAPGARRQHVLRRDASCRRRSMSPSTDVHRALGVLVRQLERGAGRAASRRRRASASRRRDWRRDAERVPGEHARRTPSRSNRGSVAAGVVLERRLRLLVLRAAARPTSGGRAARAARARSVGRCARSARCRARRSSS